MFGLGLGSSAFRCWFPSIEFVVGPWLGLGDSFRYGVIVEHVMFVVLYEGVCYGVGHPVDGLFCQLVDCVVTMEVCHFFRIRLVDLLDALVSFNLDDFLDDVGTCASP